jgi:hypothetical protein
MPLPQDHQPPAPQGAAPRDLSRKSMNPPSTDGEALMDSLNLQSKPVPRTVVLGPYLVLNWLYMPLIRRMREQLGTRFIVLVPERTTLDQRFAPYCGQEDTFLPVPYFYGAAKPARTGESDAEVFERARQIEQRYGISYALDIFQQERNIALSLMAGGTTRQAFQRDAAWSASAITHATNSYFEFYEKLFAEHDVDVAMVWPRSGGEAVCATVAAKKGVLVTYPYTAKHKHYAYWATGAYCGSIQHRLAYARIGDCELLPESEIAPPARPVYMEQSRIESRYSFGGILKQMAWMCMHRAEFLWLDIKARRLGRAKRLPFGRQVRELWAGWLYFRRFARRCERDFTKITARPFVLFALQNEPEFSVQGRCKEFNDQGAIARQLALSLPAGVNLVIKEHAWIGGRQLGFYENLLALPNVIMAHPGMRAIDLIPKAAAVASLAGTVTYEAALFGKPALIFSERSEFVFLPNVTHVRDLADLPRSIGGILSRDTAALSDAYKRAAARLRKATEAIGFEATPLFYKDKSEAPAEVIDRAIVLLRDLVDLHQRELRSGRARLDV